MAHIPVSVLNCEGTQLEEMKIEFWERVEWILLDLCWKDKYTPM